MGDQTPTVAEYAEQVRAKLRARFPAVTFDRPWPCGDQKCGCAQIIERLKAAGTVR